MVPEHGAARDAHLGDDDAALPDLDVVRDLDQVVDLAPGADSRRPGGGAVDRDVRADLHVVPDLHDSHLGKLPVHVAVADEAEPVAPDDRSGVHDDAIPQHARFADGHVGIEQHLVPQPRPRAHVAARLDDRARADLGPGLDHRVRTDRGVLGDDGVRGDDGGGMDP